MSGEISGELAAAAKMLAASGVDDSRFDAEVLLADVLGFDRAHLLVERKRKLEPAERARFVELVARRGRREPLQQVRGRQEFYSRDFFVDRNVLVPRPETETLVETVLASTRKAEPLRILDVGAGSGAIAVTLALELPAARLFATDVSPQAIAVARRNAEALGARVELRCGDLCEPFDGERFDCIVSNPPYVRTDEIDALAPEIRDHEPRIALDGGADGLDVFRRLASTALPMLADGGELIVEVGCGQSAAVASIFTAAGLVVREVRRDLSGIERVVRASRG